MCKFILFLAVIVTVGYARCQDPYMNYMRLPSGAAIERIVSSATTDGGSILATLQGSKCGVTRLDANGVVLWSKLVSPMDDMGYERLYTVAEIDDGPGFYLLTSVGSIPWVSDFPAFCLVEVDGSQNVVFSNYYNHIWGNCGSTGTEWIRAQAHRTSTGGYLLTLPHNPNNTCLFGIAQGGDTLYCGIYAESSESGGEFSGVGSHLLNDGSVLLLNHTDVGPQFMRVDMDGEIIWSKTYEAASDRDYPTIAAQTSNDSIVIAGLHGSSSVWDWGFILQMDLEGNIGWHQRFDVIAQDPVAVGVPREMTISGTGEILVHLGFFAGTSHLARFSPTGHILSNHLYHDTRIMYPDDHWYPSISPRLLNNRLSLAASLEYYGEPWWSDSIMVAGANNIDELTCGLTPDTWYEEPYPTTMTVSNNGFRRGSVWFTTGPAPVVITDQDWIIEPYCVALAVGEEFQDPIWLQPTLVGQGGAVTIRSETLIKGEVRILDIQGHVVDQYRMEREELRVPTGSLNPGLYSVVLVSTFGGRHLGRFVVAP